MHTSDRELQQIEVLWSRFKERRIDAPDMRIEGFAAEFPEHQTAILRMFPVMQELEMLTDGDRPDLEQETIPETIGRYPIVRKIGTGGMGVVYEAHCDALRERIAIKVISSDRLDPKNIRRFEEEARAVASLHHTNIVPIYEFGQERGKHFYTMRLVDGPNLADAIRLAELGEHNDLSEFGETEVRAYQLLARVIGNWSLLAELGCQAAMALEHAHSREVLHRDIKPANLLVDGADKLWITDFGLAKRIMADTDLTSMFQTVGTPRYMAPEQVKGLADHRSDIYSLGLTLYELAVLQSGENPNKAYSGIGAPPPRSLNSKVPPELDHIIVKATQPDPALRYQSAADMASDLETCARKIKTRVGRTWRGTLIAAGLAILALALGLSVIAGLSGMFASSQPRHSPRTSLTVLEGEQVATTFDERLGDLTGFRLEGQDAGCFQIDPVSRELRFSRPTDYEVPLDRDMDNSYELIISHGAAESRVVSETLRVRVANVNEAPRLDEFLFGLDGETLAKSSEELADAWTIEVIDDQDSVFDGLYFSLTGGRDRERVRLTPQGVFLFGSGEPDTLADAQPDGVLEIDLTISDQTQIWVARLEQRSGGRIALVKERVAAGAELESIELAPDCLVRRDVIDFATADGRTFYHIHADGSETTALFRSQLTPSGIFESELLSENCGIGQNAMGLATRDGKTFLHLERRRGHPNSVQLVKSVLQDDGVFASEAVSDACGIPHLVGGFSWLDSNRFHHIHRQATGEAYFNFSFLSAGQFTNRRLQPTAPQYHFRSRGQAAWIEQSADSKSVSRHIRIDASR